MGAAVYHYEALGDERFQEFCQALISASFPSVQCLPVGQPDGGRDAYLRYRLLEHATKSSAKDIIVFQVKYVRNPKDTRDERDMIEEVVKNERPKVERLKEFGLFKYYLITNVKGTAHLDVGSIDRTNKLLTELLGIDAYCWWRDDVDRRLDGSSSVKWSYPEVLKATDLLETLVSGRLGEEEERRRSAIGSRVCIFLGRRASQTLRVKLATMILDVCPGQLTPEIQFAMDAVLTSPSDHASWKIALNHIRSLYARGAVARYLHPRDDQKIPESIAAEVSATPDEFPLALVANADSRLRSLAGTNAAKLMDVATDEKWFFRDGT